jgi:hypothetical protein
MTAFNTNDVMYNSELKELTGRHRQSGGVPYVKADELQQGGATKKLALHSALALTVVLVLPCSADRTQEAHSV